MKRANNLIFLFFTVICLYPCLFASSVGFEILEPWIQAQHKLPRYVEANYSPLGRSPVVDAILGDPFYLPVYAETVSQKIKEITPLNRLEKIATQSFLAAGIPIERQEHSLSPSKSQVPQQFLQAFGNEMGDVIYHLWKSFLTVYLEVEEILSSIKPEEKEWLLKNCEAFFFGNEGNNKYDFFTTDSKWPLQFFEIASRVDLARLAQSAIKLSFLTDTVFQQREKFSQLQLQEDFSWQEQELKLLISNRQNTIFKESADFFLHLSGNAIFKNNAGGTEGKRAAALHINLKGNNLFIGDRFVQGAGILGIGLLANFGGHNTYKAKSYSQSAGFFGTGIVWDLEGENHYQTGFFGQSAAVFGSSLLWNPKGGSLYVAHDGMAQAASSTLGTAFLLEGEGRSEFVLGRYGAGNGDKAMGIGQGGAVGVRGLPWKGTPSFYGGMAYLYAGGDRNVYQGSWYSQGSAYFLGCGILIDESHHANFSANVNSQGQGLHLAAGLLLKKGGTAYFDCDWGAMGVAGDRSLGMLINTGGNNDYKGGEQTLGTSRKPLALGIFLDWQGNNSFVFGEQSSANIQWPATPLEWSQALFFSTGIKNTYSEGVDSFLRSSGTCWGIPGKSLGIDLDIVSLPFEKMLQNFPQVPRIEFPFDPIQGWGSNTAFRPLDHQDRIVERLSSEDYEGRRRLYESLDLMRFVNAQPIGDLFHLLANPSKTPEDLLNYALLWAIYDNDFRNLGKILNALREERIPSSYSRKMAIKFIGSSLKTNEGGATDRPHSPSESETVLVKVLEQDTSEENRATAAYYLAKNAHEKSIDWVESASKSKDEKVRFAVAYGLRESEAGGVLKIVIPLFEDPSFYVRRAAALTAISLCYKEAISVFLDTLDYATLDTTENYGDNLFNNLSEYVGVNFGINKADWISWWQNSKNSFEFPESTRSHCYERR